MELALLQSEIAAELERFIRTRFQISQDDPVFGRETDLWDAGYLDSLGVVDIIEFLQNRFAVSVRGEAVFDPDFVRINGMARLAFRLLTSAEQQVEAKDLEVTFQKSTGAE
jgi:acyl carrier protein